MTGRQGHHPITVHEAYPRPRAPRPARNGVASWTVTLVASSMAFLASLALAAVIGADRMADRWTGELAHTATIVMPPDSDPQALAELRTVLGEDPNIASVDPISRPMAERELAAFLGEEASVLEGLPLAPMVDIAFHAPARDAAPILRQRLRQADIPAIVDPHDDFAGRLRAPAAQLKGVAITAMAVIGIAAALMVSLACGAALAAHSDMVNMLRVVGARGGFIAQLFERPLQINAFVGAAAGTALAFMLVVWPEAVKPAEPAWDLAPLLLDLRPGIDDWPAFVGVPLVFALIATAAARIAVAFALRRPEE